MTDIGVSNINRQPIGDGMTAMTPGGRKNHPRINAPPKWILRPPEKTTARLPYGRAFRLVLSFLPGKICPSPEAQYIGRRKNLAGKAGEYNIPGKSSADPAGPERTPDTDSRDGRNPRVKPACRF
jgi:hypothetical protein